MASIMSRFYNLEIQWCCIANATKPERKDSKKVHRLSSHFRKTVNSPVPNSLLKPNYVLTLVICFSSNSDC